MEENKEKMESSKVAGIILLVLLFLVSIGGGIVSYNMRHSDSAPASSASGDSVKRPSDYKIGIPYEKASKDSKPALVLFYADWCHFCIDFMPKYEKLYNSYKNDMNFVKINVEDPKYKDLVQEYQIGGFPTVFLINFKNGEKQHLDNGIFRDMPKLSGEVSNFIKNNK